MSDIFQEVEEDVRRERYEQLWKKYGNYIIAAAALLVVGVAGYQTWSASDRSQREQVSDRFEAALRIPATDAAKAEAEWLELSKTGYDGYATLAKFNLVGTYLAQNKRDAAIATLRELTEADDETVSSVARVRLAWTEADARPRAEIATIVQPLTAPENPWRFAAAEVIAYTEYKSGSRAQAEADYLRLSQEPEAAPGLRQRAGAILQYLRANPASGAAPPAPAGAAPPAPAGAAPPAPAPTTPTAPIQGTTK